MIKELRHSLCIGFVSAILVGCQAAPSVAPRSNLQVQSLGNFAKKDIEFYANQFFLWPEGVTPEQISRVLALSDNIERLEREINPASKRLQELVTKLDANEPEILKQEQDLNKKKTPLTKSLRDKETALKKRNIALEGAKKAEEEEKKKEHPDPDQLKMLAEAKKKLEDEISVFEKERAGLVEQITALVKTIEDLRNGPDQIEKIDVEAKIAKNFSLKNSSLEEVTKIVTWHDPAPKPVSFHFESDGSVNASIVGWNLDRNEENRDFSSKVKPGKKPTIVNLKYSEQGGIFDFDVNVYEDFAQSLLRETYSFHIARTKYDSGDGKIYYTGSMNRTRVKADGVTELRRGIAKLVDINN